MISTEGLVIPTLRHRRNSSRRGSGPGLWGRRLCPYYGGASRRVDRSGRARHPGPGAVSQPKRCDRSVDGSGGRPSRLRSVVLAASILRRCQIAYPSADASVACVFGVSPSHRGSPKPHEQVMRQRRPDSVRSTLTLWPGGSGFGTMGTAQVCQEPVRKGATKGEGSSRRGPLSQRRSLAKTLPPGRRCRGDDELRDELLDELDRDMLEDVRSDCLRPGGRPSGLVPRFGRAVRPERGPAGPIAPTLTRLATHAMRRLFNSADHRRRGDPLPARTRSGRRLVRGEQACRARPA